MENGSNFSDKYDQNVKDEMSELNKCYHKVKAKLSLSLSRFHTHTKTKFVTTS
jgi:hypothetical protein